MAPTPPSQSAPASQAGSRRVSFSSTASAEPSASVHRSSTPSVPGRRGSIGAGAHGGIRLRPLTQLNPQTRASSSISPPPSARSPVERAFPPTAFPSLPHHATSSGGFVPMRRMSISAGGQVSVEDRGAPLAPTTPGAPVTSSTASTPAVTPGIRTVGQSAHSRRGSMSAEQYASSQASYFPASTSASQSAIRAESVPSYTAGARPSMSRAPSAGPGLSVDIPPSAVQTRANSPSRFHPYDLVEPGQEHVYLNRTAPASPYPAPTVTSTGRARAHTTMSARRPSSIAGKPLAGGGGSQRAQEVGARRFTSTASTGPGPTASQVAAMHGRRFSTVAREPAVSITARPSAVGLGLPIGEARPARHSSDATAPWTWVQSLRGDAGSLVISLKALLGRDGGAEAVGELVSLVLHGGLVKARDALYALLQAAGKDVSSLQTAYVQVHLHNLLVQVQEIAALVSADPTWLSSFKQVVHLLTGGAVPPPTMLSSQSPAPDSSTRAALAKGLQYLYTSPVYQSAFLRLLDVLSQFLLAAEPGRQNLWQTLGETLLAPPEPGSPIDKDNPLQSLFISACAAVEQLTGAPIRPLIRALIEWAAFADEALTELATETHEFLSSQSPAASQKDFVPHPLGYVFSPSETSARMATVVARWTAVLSSEPYKSAASRLIRAFEQTMIGVAGNSTFARFARDAVRVWDRLVAGDETGATSKVQGAMEVARVLAEGLVAVPVSKLETADENVELTLEDVVVSAVDALPDEVSINHHRKVGVDGLVDGTTVRLEGVQLVAKGAKYTVRARKGVLDVADSGQADFRISLDVKVALSPSPRSDETAGPTFSAGFGVPCFDEAKVCVRSCDVSFTSPEKSIKDSAVSLVWPLAKKAIVSRIESASKQWLETTLLGWLPSKPVAAPRQVTAKRSVTSRSSHPRRSTGAATPFGGFPVGGGDTHGTARDRFKASVRQLTGIKMGVLEQLQNPLSEPSSPALGSDDETSDVEPAPVPAAAKAKSPSTSKYRRRQSMAQHLTDIARTDSTLPDHIERPPVHGSTTASRLRSLPSVFDDEDEYAASDYDTMARSLSTTARRDTTGYDAIIRPPLAPGGDAIHMLSHRGALASFPTGEMTVDQFAAVEAAMGHEAAVRVVGGGEYPSMAGSLSELAARDATTEEAIARPPTLEEDGKLPEVPLARRAMSMNQVTRHLSGVPDFDDLSTVMGGGGAAGQEGGGRQRQSSYDLVPEAHPEHKVVMADQLTEQSMADHTLPEMQAKGHLNRRFSVADNTRAPERVPMGKSLTREASMDATLPENIMSPPTSRQGHQHHRHHRLSSVSIGSPVPVHDRDGSFGSRGGSFSLARSPLAMSTVLDDDLMRDETTPQAQLAMSRSGASSRRGSVPEGDPPSLSADDLRKRRQSFKLSDEAMRDATLISSIETPAVHRPSGDDDAYGQDVSETDLERLRRSRAASSAGRR